MLTKSDKEEIKLLEKVTPNAKILFTAAKAAQKKAYAPRTKTLVGASLLTGTGKVFSGCNIEMDSRISSACAEQIAVGAAFMNGERDLTEVFIIKGESLGALPCGACRQMIRQLSLNCKIHIKDNESKNYISVPVSVLLPGEAEIIKISQWNKEE